MDNDKNSNDVFMTVFLLVAVAFAMQVFVNYLDMGFEFTALVMPLSMTIITVLIAVFCEKDSAYQTSFKILSLVLVTLFLIGWGIVSLISDFSIGWNH